MKKIFPILQPVITLTFIFIACIIYGLSLSPAIIFFNYIIQFSVDSKHKVKVRNFTNFGIFVELKEGVDGLIHISDLSWTRKIRLILNVFKRCFFFYDAARCTFLNPLALYGLIACFDLKKENPSPEGPLRSEAIGRPCNRQVPCIFEFDAFSHLSTEVALELFPVSKNSNLYLRSASVPYVRQEA